MQQPEVVQHMLDGVVGHGTAAWVLSVVLVQPVPNLCHGRTFIVPLEGFCNKGSRKRIRLKPLLCINDVTDGNSPTIILSFERIFRHTTHDLLGQVGGIVFSVTFQHRFQDDTLRPVLHQ